MSSDCVSLEEESPAFFPRVSTAGRCVLALLLILVFWSGEERRRALCEEQVGFWCVLV